MIQQGTFLNIIDNSGAKKVKCLKIVNAGFQQRYANIGSLILVSVKSIRFSKNIKVKKGGIYPALIIKTKSNQFLKSYNYRQYYDNLAVIVTKKNKLLGTRIFINIPKQFKTSKFLKMATLASGLSF